MKKIGVSLALAATTMLAFAPVLTQAAIAPPPTLTCAEVQANLDAALTAAMDTFMANIQDNAVVSMQARADAMLLPPGKARGAAMRAAAGAFVDGMKLAKADLDAAQDAAQAQYDADILTCTP